METEHFCIELYIYLQLQLLLHASCDQPDYEITTECDRRLKNLSQH